MTDKISNPIPKGKHCSPLDDTVTNSLKKDASFPHNQQVQPSQRGALMGASGVRDTNWIDGWLQRHPDSAMHDAISHPMIDATISKVSGRRILIKDQWLFDFASCNYLGFDLDPEIQAVIPGEIDQRGHSPQLVEDAWQSNTL